MNCLWVDEKISKTSKKSKFAPHRRTPSDGTNFELVKIWFWDGFGPIWNPDSNSAWKAVYIHRSRSSFHRFLKIWFLLEFIFLFIFWLLSGISRSGSIKIERSMKKYPRGLILRFFGQMGGPNSPKTCPNQPEQPQNMPKTSPELNLA